MTDNEVLQALKDVLKPINNKLDDIELKLESLRLENKMEHRTIRQDIQPPASLLETKGILPTTQNPFSMVV